MSFSTELPPCLDPWTDPPEVEPANPLLEKLVTDSQGAALLTAAISSTINAMSKPGVMCSPSDLQSYLPNANGMALALRILERHNQLPDVHDAISTFVAGLDPALREMEHYFSDCGMIGVERAIALHQLSLAQVWRHASDIAAEAIWNLDRSTQAALPELYNLSAGILMRLLNAAARGQSPCLNANGHPFLPALPQRRRAARRILGQPATVTVDRCTQYAFVRDVSQGGIGLEQVNGLVEGENAVVALSTGRRFTGTVVWQKAQRAGIRLTVALNPNDPLLWG
ncbi:MAG: PilZ domain-containing protein [Hyphomicrobiaceae bacterium]